MNGSPTPASGLLVALVALQAACDDGTGPGESPPSPVSDVAATAVSDTEIDVTWRDNADDEEEFVVEREMVDGGGVGGHGAAPTTAGVFEEVGRVGADVTLFRDAGLAPTTTYRYRVTACNRGGCATPAESDPGGTSTHATLLFETDVLPDGVVGEPYEATLEASGGTGSFQWEVSAGTLPDGLTLSAGGVISGSPNAPGAFDFTVRVASGGQEAEGAFSVTVIAPPTVATSELPSGVVGEPYEASLEATGGDGSYLWEVVDGTLPTGLALSGDGTIAGTPTPSAAGVHAGPGISRFTVRVTSAGLNGTAELSIGVFEPLAVVTTFLATGVEGEPYEDVVEVEGGDGAYTFEVTHGALPDGLSLDPVTGRVEGTPTTTSPAPGPGVGLHHADGVPGGRPGGSGSVGAHTGTVSTFGVRITSGDGQHATTELSITVFGRLEIVTASLPNAEVGEAYEHAVEVRGGNGDDTFSVVGGMLPDGLDLEPATGVLAGTPGTAGTTGFTLRVESGDGQAATRELSLSVITGPVEIVPTMAPDGTVGTAYEMTVEAEGGDLSYIFQIVSGGLPPGIGLEPETGRIVGTPSEAGTFDFVIEVTSAGLSDARPLSVEVAPGPVSIDSEVLPVGHLGVPYAGSVRVSGGDGRDYHFDVVEGAPPDGVTLDGTTGALQGTPTATGNAYLTVRVRSAGFEARRALNLTVSTAPPEGFNIQAVDVSDDLPSEKVRAALDAALARWEQIIVADDPDMAIPDPFFGAEGCDGDGGVLDGEDVDDVAILINVERIDGTGLVLGFASPCGLRPEPVVRPFAGFLALDEVDMENRNFEEVRDVAFHEIGHVLGFGTLWSDVDEPLRLDVLTARKADCAPGRDPLEICSFDPRYDGEEVAPSEAVARYREDLNGADDDIPVENCGLCQEGSADIHWRETVFDHELMTTFAENRFVEQPVSIMTVGAMADLGYGVDFSAADPYAIPAAPPRIPSRAEREAVGWDVVPDEPLYVLMPDGSVRVVPRRGPGG